MNTLELFAAHIYGIFSPRWQNGLIFAIVFSLMKFYFDWNAKRRVPVLKRVYVFTLAFYSFILLDAALLSREGLDNPLSKITDGWMLVTHSGYDFYVIVNLLMLLPIVALLFAAEPKLAGRGFAQVAGRSAGLALFVSLLIESCQLVFSAGTFQFSDLVYNTAGGLLGGLVYYIGHAK